MEFDKMLEEQLKNNPDGIILLAVMSVIFSGEAGKNEDRRAIEDSSEN